MFGIMDVYKSLNISIGRVMKNPEMLKFVSDHLEIKKMCKHAVKEITLSIKISYPYLINLILSISIRLNKMVEH